jgi:hypothetical protein
MIKSAHSPLSAVRTNLKLSGFPDAPITPDTGVEEATAKSNRDTIPIPDILQKNGFTYNKVRVGAKAAIFRQQVTDSVFYYEVFLIRFRRPRVFKGQELPASFWFPPDEAFGVWAWSHRTLEGATRKFLELEGKDSTTLNSTRHGH